MKKLLTVLLTALMVVTLGVVNVSAASEENRQEDPTIYIDGNVSRDRTITYDGKDHAISAYAGRIKLDVSVSSVKEYGEYTITVSVPNNYKPYYDYRWREWVTDGKIWFDYSRRDGYIT